ncbi:MAG: pantetheine-phosphate adenylyltransferase [Coriobacteriia bacterium]|nr:pantetheine-phosphate adenylyltransferase [Coriobacteriia bacterium]MCL2745795.1 pantetheine-phosphate adenylyltransferase [Coriobacteriia bacterium]MCL2870078.1 pantetheine-phosphate adenylyltransferase [Coriobacteriia bacterium]
MRKAIVPGTFDPITSGHLEIIERAHALFDEIIVGVASSWSKRGAGTLFTLEERCELACEATAHLEGVQIASFDGMLIDFVHRQNAQAIVKGLRAMTDFENEFQMAAINWRLDAQIETIFIMASPDHMYLSSSAVKEIAHLQGPLFGLVPANVEEPLRMKYS